MSVKIKDRKEDVEHFRLALCMVGVSVNYETADLIQEIYNGLNDKGGKFTVKDAGEIESEHEEKWIKYHKPKKDIDLVPE